MPPEFDVRFFELDNVAVDERLLSASERERVDRKGSVRLKQRQAASFQCLRMTLGDVLGLAPERVPIAIAGSGKPYLVDHPLRFNLSHSGGVGMLAWSASEIGADVEVLVARPTGALAEEILSAGELAHWHRLAEPDRQAWLTRAWCRKESALKAVGYGLRIPPRSLEVGGGEREGESWSLAIEGRGWRGRDLVEGVPAGYRAAVCVGMPGA